MFESWSIEKPIGILDRDPMLAAGNGQHMLEAHRLHRADVRGVCLPAYADASRGGRPGIDPAVYLKVLMIGFFQNLPGERAIASRSM